MSDYPNMSYCMCENTLLAVEQIITAMSSHNGPTEFYDSLSMQEKKSLRDLFYKCGDLMQALEEDEIFVY